MALRETELVTGSDVKTSDGQDFGTLYELAEGYILVRVPHGALTDVDQYVPRELVDRVEGDAIYLTKSADELDSMDLSVPRTLG
ncbi:MAG: DUF2171 domain-containing protein [Candidatus Binatia bacterium]